jgi:hypothetical protein
MRALSCMLQRTLSAAAPQGHAVDLIQIMLLVLSVDKAGRWPDTLWGRWQHAHEQRGACFPAASAQHVAHACRRPLWQLHAPRCAQT